ncbi:MAG TPA: hypothetical protein VMU22_16500 [Rhizomicrobium sp.]|nr:hypothetical protein [Rhizomicrobium sp.]
MTGSKMHEQFVRNLERKPDPQTPDAPRHPLRPAPDERQSDRAVGEHWMKTGGSRP